jgi:MFS family permease
MAIIPLSAPRLKRVVPLIVAVALLMENVDSSVLSTSLPAMAVDLATDPIHLKLVLTSYLLALAVFIPASGWAADRFGARVVFRAAILVFALGSVGITLAAMVLELCGTSAPDLGNFPYVFALVAGFAFASALIFARLHPDAGQNLVKAKATR